MIDDPIQQAPRKKNGQCLKLVDFLVNDILMVIFSMCDIALDILVCRKFYLADQMGFYYVSLTIFLFAQCCYSFLFTLHWGKDYSSPSKCLMFFLVLPFGQFVPFLAWIESFEFHWVDALFEALSLRSKNTRNDEVATRAFEEAGGDLLYEYIQKKFYSHAGFLVEALAEAIPQSILQTVAVLYFGEPSPLFIISIFVSICVISSKGYLISYSMHRPTFVFNFICIFADVLCMFATICWLFDYENDDDDTSELFNVHDEIKATWMCLFCAAAGALVASSGCFILFITLDKHHEVDVGARTHAYDSALIMFIELHLANFLGWFFSLIPLVVSLLTFKFIFFPISSQNQDQCNDFAVYKTFYTALHKHVSTNKSDLKLHITNRFLLYCKGNQYRLESALRQDNSVVGRKEAVREWLDAVVEDINCNNHQPRLNEENTTLYASLNSSDPKAARSTVRQFNTKSNIHFFERGFTAELATEFKLFDTFFNNDRGDDIPTCWKPLATLRYFVALLVAAIGFPLFLFFLLSAAMFLVYSWLYPLIELVRALVQNNFDLLAISTLPLCLTLAYVFTLAIMLCLAPSIYTFNRMCTDIVPLRPRLPPAFFDVMVVERIEAVYAAELNWQHLDRVFDSIFGMDVTLVIKSFCDPGALNLEGLYGSRSLRRMRISTLIAARAGDAAPSSGQEVMSNV